jgi:hypothetical protein
MILTGLMTRTLTALAVLALAGCYASGGRSHAGDASVDTVHDGVVDTVVTDTATDPGIDIVPDGWHFVDRDIPDRNIPVGLMFAAVPDIASSGSRVGLVYQGMESGAGDAVGFIPLGTRGEVVGTETVLVSGPGLASAVPRIAHAGDGSFLVAVLVESGGDRVVVQRVSADGAVLAESDEAVVPSATSFPSAPLRVGGHAFVAASSLAPGGEGIVVYRYAYPDMILDRVGLLAPLSECWGGDPIAAKDPVTDQIMILHRCTALESVIVEWMDTDLNATGATTVFGHVPVTAFHASSSGSGWMAYGFEQRLEVTSLQFWQFDPAGDLWLAPDIEANLYGPLMDSDHSDAAGYRTSGAVFAVYYHDVWEIWAQLGADPPMPPPDAGFRSNLRVVSDSIEARRMDDVPIPAIAWTEGGFLVVWDEWREDFTYSLFSSFIEIAYDY